MKRVLCGLGVLALMALPTLSEPGRAGVGLALGGWDITWIEPRLTPATKAVETRFTRCYGKADQAAGANPVMPRPQEARCTTSSHMVGSDFVFETSCPDADHQLRGFACGEGLCAVYRYVPHGRKGGILESIVFLRHNDKACEGA